MAALNKPHPNGHHGNYNYLHEGIYADIRETDIIDSDEPDELDDPDPLAILETIDNTKVDEEFDVSVEQRIVERMVQKARRNSQRDLERQLEAQRRHQEEQEQRCRDLEVPRKTEAEKQAELKKRMGMIGHKVMITDVTDLRAQKSSNCEGSVQLRSASADRAQEVNFKRKSGNGQGSQVRHRSVDRNAPVTQSRNWTYQEASARSISGDSNGQEHTFNMRYLSDRNFDSSPSRNKRDLDAQVKSSRITGTNQYDQEKQAIGRTRDQNSHEMNVQNISSEYVQNMSDDKEKNMQSERSISNKQGTITKNELEKEHVTDSGVDMREVCEDIVKEDRNDAKHASPQCSAMVRQKNANVSSNSGFTNQQNGKNCSVDLQQKANIHVTSVTHQISEPQDLQEDKQNRSGILKHSAVSKENNEGYTVRELRAMDHESEAPKPILKHSNESNIMSSKGRDRLMDCSDRQPFVSGKVLDSQSIDASQKDKRVVSKDGAESNASERNPGTDHKGDGILPEGTDIMTWWGSTNLSLGTASCSRCGHGFSRDEEIVNSSGEMWHTHCFVCAQCFRPFPDGIFYEFDKRKYCEDDFKMLFAPFCAKKDCNNFIVGRVIKAMNANWHPDCFLCELCNVCLADSGYFKNANRALCKLCNDRENAAGKGKYICMKCKSVVEDGLIKYKGEPYHAYHFNCKKCNIELTSDAREVTGELYCLRCHDKMGIPICGACRRPIDGERIVHALGKSWHVEHFVCAQCEKPFLGTRHYEKKGLAYCETHYHQLFGNICFTCNKVIEGDVFSALNKAWCVNHFACSICDKKMSQKTKFYEFDLKPACKHCYEKFPSELKKRLKKAYESSPKK